MEKIKEELTDEEIEILKNILLERSTFHTNVITEYKFLLIKLPPEKESFIQDYEKEIDISYKYKNTIDKLFNLLGE